MPLKPDCEWIDAMEKARIHPVTFFIPPAEARLRMKAGDYCKIGIRFLRPVTFWGRPCFGERFWVRVISLDPLCGVVEQSDIIHSDTHGIVDGETVKFGQEHIMEIYRDQKRKK